MHGFAQQEEKGKKGGRGEGIPDGCSSPAKTWWRAAALAQSSPQGRKAREREREREVNGRKRKGGTEGGAAEDG